MTTLYRRKPVRPRPKDKVYTEPQIASVRGVCNRVNPAMPGGTRCSFPKCYHSACRDEIQAGLEQMRQHA